MSGEKALSAVIVDGRPVDQETLESRLKSATSPVERENLLLGYCGAVNEELSRLRQELEQEIGKREAIKQEYEGLEAELEKARSEIEGLQRTDPFLTELYNKRYFLERLNGEISRSRRTGSPFTVVMIDVDYFKKYNDTFGHLQGDEALIQLSRLLKETLRDIDIPARYGGEEFALLLPGTNKKGTRGFLNRLYPEVRSMGIRISAGAFIFQPDKDSELDATDIVSRADEALYRAKERGRDRYRISRTN